MPVPIVQHNFFSSIKTYIFNVISISFYIIILITLMRLKKQKIYKIIKRIDIIILIIYINITS